MTPEGRPGAAAGCPTTAAVQESNIWEVDSVAKIGGSHVPFGDARPTSIFDPAWIATHTLTAPLVAPEVKIGTPTWVPVTETLV
jgi:hypothetical protein